jgi:hypothetical protein
VQIDRIALFNHLLHSHVFAATGCGVAIHCLGGMLLVFRGRVAEVGELPITTVTVIEAI